MEVKLQAVNGEGKKKQKEKEKEITTKSGHITKLKRNVVSISGHFWSLSGETFYIPNLFYG